MINKIKKANFIGFLIYLIILGFLGFSDNSLLPVILTKYDKLLHFSCFFGFSLTFHFIWDLTDFKKHLIFTTFTSFLAGISSEILQDIITEQRRSFDFEDIIYNLLGSLVGIILILMLERLKNNKKKYQSLPEETVELDIMV